MAGSLWASRRRPSQGCERRHPRAGGLLARDPPLLSALGGTQASQKPCTMSVFLEAAG